MASKTAVEVCKFFYQSPDMSPEAAVQILGEQGVTVTVALAAAWKRDLGSILEALKELGALSNGAAVIPKKPKRVRAPSRASRWSDACNDASDAIGRLKELQEEYSDWKDNLPENLLASPVGEKLEAVCDLDLDGAESTIGEAEGLDLPMGFGRD